MCEVDEVDILRARAVYVEVMRPVGNGKRRQTALVERLVSLTDPEMVEETNMLESWKAKYKHKITVRLCICQLKMFKKSILCISPPVPKWFN